MAPEPHGRAAHQNHNSFAHGLANMGPPPSTLAAQLVENISTPAKSSRPDETQELRKLFGVIENVKNHPELLKTTDDRIEHNHMLIYVYARVALDSLKWDDPFADRASLLTEALKAINFLKVTIKETPAVLAFTTDGDTFLFRGREPLWLWTLPKVLKMLGHVHCLSLSSAIESFCQLVLVQSTRSDALRGAVGSIIGYFRCVVEDISCRLGEIAPSGRDVSIDLEVPARPSLENLIPGAAIQSYQGWSYRLLHVSHASRQAALLLSTLAKNVLASKTDVSCNLRDSVPWLLDSLLSFHEAQKRWHGSIEYSISSILKCALDLCSAYGDARDVNIAVRDKIHCQLALLCSKVLELPAVFSTGNQDGTSSRHIFCLCILQLASSAAKNKAVARLVNSQLLVPLGKLATEKVTVGDGSDFQRCVEMLKKASTSSTPDHADSDTDASHLEDAELRRCAKALRPTLGQDNSAQPAPKRRKVSAEPSLLPPVLERLFLLLGMAPSSDIASLEHSFLDAFQRLSDEDRSVAIDLLTLIPCASDDTLLYSRPDHGASAGLRCSFCSHPAGDDQVPKCLDIAVKSKVTAIFQHLTRLPSFMESRRPRIVAIISLRRLLRHSKDAELLDLETSVPGQWCLQSLQSSIRELRIAAGRTIISFLRPPPLPGIDVDIAKRNRVNLLGILKSLTERNSAHLKETCIMAWGQVGRIVPDEELNLVLIQLLETLGHRNQIVSAFAFNEILSLAGARDTTPRHLLAPFWKNLAFSAVKDMVTRPQTTRMIAELLHMSVPELVLLIQQHALPWLVLTKRREVVQKIAEYRGEKETWRPCVDQANLSSILALLLSQDVPDTEIEQFTMSLLRHISGHFNNSSLLELFGSTTVPTIIELLKAAGEAEDGQKSRIRDALKVVAHLLLPPDTKQAKKKNTLGRFIQQYALGITSHLAESINENIARPPPVQEQRRCIHAMEEMIKLCRAEIRIARLQISAFLLTAFSYDELRIASFSCWAAMLTHLEDEYVEALVETTFFVVGHYWQSFDMPTREMARDVLLTIISKQKALVADKIYDLPSLGGIPDLADIDKKLRALRSPIDDRLAFVIFARRIAHENSGVVLEALAELAVYLREHQAFLQTSAISEQPDSVLKNLLRTLLDCSSKYSGVQSDIARLCVECIGLVGCVDSNRVETVREQRQFVVRHNFEDAIETTDFVLFILEEVLVKSFLSATNPHFQGFLSYAMQELLEKCNFKAAVALQGQEDEDTYRKWLSLPEPVREVLEPFMTSAYRVMPIPPLPPQYPIFRPARSCAAWLRFIVLDLLNKGQNAFAQVLFAPLSRAIRVKEPAVGEFLLPYLVIHIIVGDDSSQADRDNVTNELLAILQYELSEDASYTERQNMKLYCEAVFRVLDYAMRWMQSKKSQPGQTKRDEAQIKRVQLVLDKIPAELISQRAVDCKQYARALFYLEPFIRTTAADPNKDPKVAKRLLSELQNIYTHIDDPDGLDGMSARVVVIDLDQQILSHRKAGRWTTVQTWYEIRLAKEPENVDVQLDLLTCLKESGQHDVLLNHVEGMNTTPSTINRIAPFAVEASWATGRWETLQKYLDLYNGGDITEVFNLGVAQALLCLKGGQFENLAGCIRTLRERVASSMSYSATSSLQASHEAMLKAHVLVELEILAERPNEKATNQQERLTLLDRRLEVLGAYVNDKQYLLGIRRAAMELMRPGFEDSDISSLWLSTARLARKAGSMQQSFNAVLHATQLGDGSATIDNARLLWKEGHHREAIQVLKGAIANDSFIGPRVGSAAPTSSRNQSSARNMITARAHLLLAKWQDSTGQTHAGALRRQYQQAAKTHAQWEKGHYYLGRHYKKVLEAEKTLKPDDQSDEYLSGETAKLVIENYLRSLNFGTKYLYQTLPRILTLWLELGAQLDKGPFGKVSVSRELFQRRKTQLQELHKYLDKQLARMPAYIFYTALPQIVARIAHPNSDVFARLERVIVKVVEAHPRQALWSLFGIMTSKQTSERRARGQMVLQKLRAVGGKVEGGSYELRQLLRMGEKLADQLLLACNNGDFQSNRTTVASITRDLNFNHKCTPCPLVVPVEGCLTATLPTLTDSVKKHKAFARDLITIDSFLDEVLVLGSLAKPRKLTARGSDGNSYGLLIKPKDDLRTDQRLMEFNGMINRSLKRDAESSRRQLYIRTYAVTPLNEECGIIEWVDGLKTLRDILLALYKARGITPNYSRIAQMMKEATTSVDNNDIFEDQIMGMFPEVLPDWFASQFPGPLPWFAARLRYTRSCAVMSMVGTILGLGDRHGENVLLEEGNGGIFHVDFNCLFDKGLTFSQPERVPFRLTHNMEAAMGVCGHEGVFRKCCELTLAILRQQEETLMTILEAFIYDPTLDLQKDKKRRHEGVVQLNPQSVVESIKRKVQGLLPDESIPLGVEGQVEELIQQATDPGNLAAMYIGWCPFL